MLSILSFSLLANCCLLALAQNSQFPAATIDPTTSKGDLGPFTPAKAPSSAASGVTTKFTTSQLTTLTTACNNWVKDTGMVSNFLNIGKGMTGSAFMSAANIGYKAEVDELTWKAQLDNLIGNDPLVSIANLTLTNGVFQSVVNNLAIMAAQGSGLQNLIDNINAGRCKYILFSIDQYCIKVAQLIGQSSPNLAIRPTACAGIVANDQDVKDYPNLPGLPGATVQQEAPLSAASDANAAAAPTTTTAAGKAGRGKGGRGRRLDVTGH